MKSVLRRLRNLTNARSHPQPPQEIFLQAIGQRWIVRYRKTAARWVQARCNGNGQLTVSGSIMSPREVNEALRRWLVRQARNSLVHWLSDLSRQAGLSYGTVSVRGQRTRWASCSSMGNINLNYRLLFLPPDLVRYVLIHELCHTRHLNHSRDFWTLLASLEPGYRALNQRVKRGMDEVPEWARDWK